MRRVGLRGTTSGGFAGAAVVGALILASLVRLWTGVVTEAPETKDGTGYVSIAFSLSREGQFSWFGAEPGAGTMYREPFPIWVKAAQIRLDPRLRAVEGPELINSVGGPEARALRQLNVVWAGLLLAGIAMQVGLLCRERNARATLLMVISVAASHALLLEYNDMMDRTLSELPAAALLVWVGVTATRFTRSPSARSGAIVGLLTGLLVLTRSAYLYVGLVWLPLLGLIMLASRERAERSRVLAGTIAALLAVALVVAPWIARNERMFGVAAVSENAGLGLRHRVLYNEASSLEHRGMWYYFAPGPLQRNFLGGALAIEPSDFDDGGRLRRLHRFSDEDEPLHAPWSFYGMARRDRAVMRALVTEELVATGTIAVHQVGPVADARLLAESMSTLRADPGAFVRTTPVFLWRGTWVIVDSNVLPAALFAPFNLVGMSALLAAAVLAIVRRRPALAAVALLPAGGVLFNALLSIFEPRHTRPAVPVMIVLVVLAADRLVRPWVDARSSGADVRSD